MAFNPAQQPLWPFITDIPIAGRPVPGGLSLGMTTDVTFTSTIALRYKYGELYSSVASSDGSIEEQLIVDITGLTPGQEYTFIVEFAVAGGSFITSESSITLTIPDDTINFIHVTDSHCSSNNMNDEESDNFKRYPNVFAAASEPSLCIFGGDEVVADIYADEADAHATMVQWRTYVKELIKNKICLFVDGNRDSRELPYQQALADKFWLNPVDQNANGKFWKVELGPCLFIGIEPYTTSGFGAFDPPPDLDVADPTEWDISVEEKAILASIETTQCPWVFIFEHQLIGGAVAYGIGGGSKILAAGTYQETLHNLIKTYYAKNRRIKRIFILRGHDHQNEHYTIDEIEYIETTSPTHVFPARRNETAGYLDGLGDPVGQYSEATTYGYLKASFNWHSGRIQFIQTSDDYAPVSNIVYEIGFGETTDPIIEITTGASTRNTAIVNVRGSASDA